MIVALCFVAAIAQATRPVVPRPSGLFGSHEYVSNDLSSFTKWSAMLARSQEQMSTAPRGSLLSQWRVYLDSLKGRSRMAQIMAVNETLNLVPYMSDETNYGREDYWATPAEFLALGGDCEDYAIAKYASLRALGFAPEQLRIVIVDDLKEQKPHAILVVYEGGDVFVLDSQSTVTARMQDVTRYVPVFSINALHWWRHLHA